MRIGDRIKVLETCYVGGTPMIPVYEGTEGIITAFNDYWSDFKCGSLKLYISKNTHYKIIEEVKQ